MMLCFVMWFYGIKKSILRLIVRRKIFMDKNKENYLNNIIMVVPQAKIWIYMIYTLLIWDGYIYMQGKASFHPTIIMEYVHTFPVDIHIHIIQRMNKMQNDQPIL